LLSYEGMVAHLHQDYVQQPPVRQIEIIGSAGKMSIDLRALSVAVYGGAGESIASHAFEGFERNKLFVDELESFINAIETRGAVPVGLSAGRQSLEMALAVRRSIDTGAIIDMGVPA
jgi:predicted dehydrogenase